MAEKKEMLKLSVCVITYNHEKFIRSTLESIIDQQFDQGWEIVIADDYSTDGTRIIIKEFEARYPHIVKLIFQPKNIGPALNFKDLILAAQGEYVAYLDGDDMMLSGKIKKQMRFLEENKDCTIVAHNMQVEDADKHEQLGAFSKLPEGKYDLNYLVRNGTFFCNSSKMYRNEANKDYPYYDKLKVVGDLAWHIYQTKHHFIGYLSESLGVYRKHHKGVSSINQQRMKVAYGENILSLNLAKRFGVQEEALDFGLMREAYAYALISLKRGNIADFRQGINDSGRFNIFYSVKHRLLYKLRGFPSYLLGLIRLIIK